MGLRQQIQRIKNAKKKDVPLEERWGSSRHRRRGAKWIIFVVLAAGVPVVAIVVGISLYKKPPSETPTRRSNALVLDDPGVSYLPYDSTTPIGWFHENSVKAFDESMEILRKCCEAEDPRTLGSLLRDEERTLPKMEQHGTGFEVPFALDDPRSITWEYGESGDTGYMSISGRRTDHTSFRAYFVKTNEGLKLDWDATTAWSQIPIEKLVEEAPERPTLVRAWLSKQPDYDADIGRGSLYSWYLISDDTRTHFVWAYAPAGSNIDQKIKKLLNYGMIVMERKDEARVTLRLVKPTLGFRETEFEIVELVTEEWVMP